MQTKKLGYTDLQLTAVGLGTWAIGGQWQFGWGPQDDKDAVNTIIEALNQGINWIDTAPIYGCGHSEELVGQAIKQTAEKPIIATKCGLLWNKKREKYNSLKPESIRKECEDSLTRLGVDVIDLYQMHWPEPEEDIEQGYEEMAKLAQEGKVRYIGVSNYNINQLEKIKNIHPPASLQPPYSMLRRGVENELLDYCLKNNMGVLAYSPMQRGLLTGKFSQKRLGNLPDDDHRKKSPEFQQPQFAATLQLVEGLKKVAQRNNKTCAQLAVSWVLRREELTAAIVGARHPKQIKETAEAGDWRLYREDINEIEILLTQWQRKING